jgi:hypothetical protein
MTRRLRALDVLKRVARVREVRATQALSLALEDERVSERARDGVQAYRDAAAAVGQDCTSGSGSLDIPRYERVSHVDHLLEVRLHLAQANLAETRGEREARAAESALASRYHDRVGERHGEIEDVLVNERRALQQDEAIELWLGAEERR